MSKNIKTASGFGGVGGGYQSAYAPGNSPYGMSGKGRGGNGINTYQDEEKGTESNLEKFRRSEFPDLSIESQLLPFRKNPEEQIFYLIDDPLTRLRHKFRLQLQEYRLRLLEEAESVRKNSVEYINSHIKNDPVHFQTIEESLIQSKKHRYTPGQVFEFENDLPIPKAPERYHVANTQNQKTSSGPSQRGRITRDYPDEKRNIFDLKRFEYQEANYPLLTGEQGFEGLDRFLETANQTNQDHKGSSGYNEPNINDTFVDKYNPSPVPTSEKAKGKPNLDVNKSLEANINQEKRYMNLADFNNQSLNEEKSGLEKEYNTFGIGIHGNSF